MPLRGLLILSLCLPVFGAAADYLEPMLLTGSIYDKPQGRLLFTFRRTATQTGDVVRALREFRYPNGSIAAQERVLYERGRLVRFDLDELQIGAHGHAAIDQGRIDFQYVTGTGQGAKTRRKVETVTDNPLIADTLGPFVAAHWDELNRGATVKFRYLVVPRLETIAFKLTCESTTDFHGKKVVQIKMSPASWIISQVLDPLIFTVESDPPHRVLQYWGRTAPKLRTGQSWRDLDALTVFEWPAK
jgi:hypothetical protein